MHAIAPAARYRFGRFALLGPEQRLERDGDAVALGPRALALLFALVRRDGALATKDELLDEVWQGLVVEEANLHVQVSQLRKAIGNAAIATVPGRGYRFAAHLQDEPAATGDLALVVLPLAASGLLAGQEDFAEALTEDIADLLARLRGSHVVAHQAARIYAREPYELRSLASQLGVRYLVQGRIDRSDGRIDTTVRLLDAHSGAVLWTDTFAIREAAPALRRELAARVAHGCVLGLLQARARGANRRGEPQQQHAGDLLLRAGALARTARGPGDFDQALALVDAARALEPADPALLAYRARILASRVAVWGDDGDDERIAQADRDIAAALLGDAGDALAHCTLSRVRQLQLRMAAALTAVDQALELDPHCVEALAWRGAVLVLHGRTQDALRPLQRALELAPRDPHRWGSLFWVGKAHLLSGRYEEAVPWLERSAAVMPFWATHAFLAAANAHLDRGSETQAALAALGRPGALAERSRQLRLSHHPAYRQLRRQHYLAGLVKAGAIADVDALDRAGDAFRTL